MRKIILGLAATAAVVAPLATAAAAHADTTTVSVCPLGCTYKTIAAGVNAASAGDTVEVQSGTYTESVTVDKALTIRATAPDATVIPGPSYNDPGFKLQANNITIEGFTIGDRSAMSPTIGIDVAGTSGARIVDDNLIHNQRGVSLGGASNVLVSDTRFSDNNGSGPNDNAALWGDAVTGITVEGSTFTGHTNTAINLAGSSDVTITASTFTDNGNVAVIQDDNNVTVSGNTGTLMRASGVYLNHSNNVTVSGNDLAAKGGGNGISFAAGSAGSTAVQVTGNTLRGFVRGLNVASGALNGTGALVATDNAFLTATTGVRNQDTVLVDAHHNWWGAASGPADATAGDSSVPDTNNGIGVIAEGTIDYSDWCVTDTCQAPVQPPVKAATTLHATKLTQRDGDHVLVVEISAGQASVDGGTVAIRNAAGKRVALLVVHHGKVRTNLGNLRHGRHAYTVVFRGTETAKRAVKQVVVRVR